MAGVTPGSCLVVLGAIALAPLVIYVQCGFDFLVTAKYSSMPLSRRCWGGRRAEAIEAGVLTSRRNQL